MMKKLICLMFGLLFLHNVFAGELMSQEAGGYYNQALKAQQSANFEEAEALYQKILIIDADNPKWQAVVFNNRGAILAKQGDIAGAEILFNKALKINPNYLPAQLNLGFIYEKRRTELESIKYWLKVLKIDLAKVKPRGYVLEGEQEIKD